ncbi:uncharacterized protein DUF4129 [Arthrobacter sp. AG367]|jgi:hypothetical protein|uniref:DUF4129 domain-containing protein n=1 Tax=unclassified Arthrobacter TaxID=235627 RepID=UPI00036B9B0E|nr:MULTISPECIES: DUF4129 domain-containing protein [unclassified Arthrobacter]TWD57092.1 uncharacterized protein DUF4129 [Arthrobacter sp. AG367]BCW55212.1 membrane protein [Arthrobacter sp. StoSoilB19]
MAAEPPVRPGAGEARRWAEEELAKREYRDAAPSWLGTLWRNFLDWLQSLDGSQGDAAPVPSPVIALVIAAIIAAAVILARPRLHARSRQARDVFEREPTLGATDYRARAEAAAAAGKWGDAVVDRFRAVVRSAEDRAILDPQPGRTADEAARALSVPFNSQSGRLARAAATFDGVRYGNRAADSGDYRQMVELDTALDAMKPATAGTAAVTP